MLPKSANAEKRTQAAEHARRMKKKAENKKSAELSLHDVATTALPPEAVNRIKVLAARNDLSITSIADTAPHRMFGIESIAKRAVECCKLAASGGNCASCDYVVGVAAWRVGEPQTPPAEASAAGGVRISIKWAARGALKVLVAILKSGLLLRVECSAKPTDRVILFGIERD
ncbi:unnamed protein product [Ceratitis capitata]|uniref:(Mediterranean fruit fly) hypothetical protein n=1 Tax=Ceratitis capitata TaxID=7213 RepID=A0A811U8R6_CERCA|nr:unnamed protein product [Ceratitis capitata]